MKQNSFIIDVRDLFVKDTGIIDTYRMLDSILESDLEDFSRSIINGKLEVVKINNNDVLIEFDLNTLSYLNCVRCLKEFSLPMRMKFNQIYSLNPIKGEHEYIITNYKIDVSKVIIEESITHLPIKPLCSQRCPGIKGYTNNRKE